MINRYVRTSHLGFWLFYGLYFYLLNALGNEAISLWTVFFSLPYFAFVFYTVHYLLKRYFARRLYLKGAALLLGFYLFSSLLVYILTHAWSGAPPLYRAYIVNVHDFRWRELVQTMLVLHGHFSMLALLHFYHQEKLRATREKLEEIERRLILQQQKERYEYVALAAQVSPHMMANIFQGWRQYTRKMKPELAEQMDRVYHLMHFYMEADHPDGPRTVLLEDERAAVENYLEIQRKVVGKPFFIDFSISGNLGRFSTPPTTLLTLVKNLFKHAELNDPEFPACVSIQSGQQGYSIRLTNKKASEGTKYVSHGYGLKNLRRRLELLYGTQVSMDIRDTKEEFCIAISVEFRHLKDI